MKKAMTLMLICLALLFGSIAVLKLFILHEEKLAIQKMQHQVITISAGQAKYASWAPQYQVTGNLRPVKGVNITTQLAGMINGIYFQPGSYVRKGQLLVTLNTKPDEAKLHELQANARFAKITYLRDKKQYAFGAVSKETLDSDEAKYHSTAELVKEQKETIQKKIIKAPFAGRLGISQVNLGQYLNPGDSIVTLQTLNPIYLDFYIPQETLGKIHLAQIVNMTLDRVPGQTFRARITTINPIVDTKIRNVEIEATLSNPDELLLPGMFTNVSFYTGKSTQYLTLPMSAITFNPYGSLVFLLHKTKQVHNGKTVWKARQQFVTTGETHNSLIAIKKGVKEGDWVVTAGQIKLRNDALVVINNVSDGAAQ